MVYWMDYVLNRLVTSKRCRPRVPDEAILAVEGPFKDGDISASLAGISSLSQEDIVYRLEI